MSKIELLRMMSLNLFRSKSSLVKSPLFFRSNMLKCSSLSQSYAMWENKAANPIKSNFFTRGFCNGLIRNSSVFHVENDDQFSEKVLNSPIPVIVDFYADWCGPCHMLGPRIEAKVQGTDGMISLAKINIDTAADLAMDYDVQAVPTVIAFKDGNIVGRFEGDHPDEYLEDFISDIVNK